MSATRTITLFRGERVIIDAADYEREFEVNQVPGALIRICDKAWHASGTGQWRYAYGTYCTTSHQYKVPMHRLIMGAKRGQFIDHANGNRFDNRRSNLRFCTHQQNIWNSKRKRSASSQFKGVTQRGGGWRAQIHLDGKTIVIGDFSREEDAARAYDQRAKHLFGEFAWLNFPHLVPLIARAARADELEAISTKRVS